MKSSTCFGTNGRLRARRSGEIGTDYSSRGQCSRRPCKLCATSGRRRCALWPGRLSVKIGKCLHSQPRWLTALKSWSPGLIPRRPITSAGEMINFFSFPLSAAIRNCVAARAFTFSRLMLQLALFDIDNGSDSHDGAGIKAFGKAFEMQFKIPDGTAGMKFAGRTDTGLARELFLKHGVETSRENFQLFFDCYLDWLAHLLTQARGDIFPGVWRFIYDLQTLPNPPVLGLLTGNLRLGAELKLRHFNVWDFFQFGAFADDHEERTDRCCGAVRFACAWQAIARRRNPCDRRHAAGHRVRPGHRCESARRGDGRQHAGGIAITSAHVGGDGSGKGAGAGALPPLTPNANAACRSRTCRRNENCPSTKALRIRRHPRWKQIPRISWTTLLNHSAGTSCLPNCWNAPAVRPVAFRAMKFVDCAWRYGNTQETQVTASPSAGKFIKPVGENTHVGNHARPAMAFAGFDDELVRRANFCSASRRFLPDKVKLGTASPHHEGGGHIAGDKIGWERFRGRAACGLRRSTSAGRTRPDVSRWNRSRRRHRLPWSSSGNPSGGRNRPRIGQLLRSTWGLWHWDRPDRLASRCSRRDVRRRCHR